MLNMKMMLAAAFMLFVFSASASDTATVNKLIRDAKTTIAEDPAAAAGIARSAYEIAFRIGFDSGAAQGLKLVGNAYYFRREYGPAIDYWKESLKVFERMKDDAGMSNIYNNIGAVYFDQGIDSVALDFYLKSLELAEKSGDKVRLGTVLNNIGGIYFNKKPTYNKAIDYFTRSLNVSIESKDPDAIGTAATNLGEVYAAMDNDSAALRYYNFSLSSTSNDEVTQYTYNLLGKLYLKEGKYTTALTYHQKAYNISEKFDQLYTVQALIGIASVYEKMGDVSSTLSSYQKAVKIAEEISAEKELEHIYKGLAASFEKLGDYKQAYTFKTRYALVREKLYNTQADNKLALKDYDFNLKRQQDRIDILTKENQLKQEEVKRQKLAKSALIAGLGLVFMIVVILYRNYRGKVKTNHVLDKQKAEIQSLLGNILPEEVAQELQMTGVATPRRFENVSVMFTDFKGFTAIADKLSPEAVVEEIGNCFIAFDNIIDKYNLEKIKTIGDSYMCAGGVPVKDPMHVYNIVRASLEILDYLAKENAKRKEMGRDTWELRIGINVGPVVAGVVGKRKYAYDIWGSTVNIASRMESNGVPGRVNISATTYELIKDKFNCSYRGKINAKNIGDIDMYFVDSEKEPAFEADVHEVLNPSLSSSRVEEVAS